ncbi:hypothetical protein N9L68_02835 [bacterium]|nr:hypothetical protein [bacterium]
MINSRQELMLEQIRSLRVQAKELRDATFHTDDTDVQGATETNDVHTDDKGDSYDNAKQATE